MDLPVKLDLPKLSHFHVLAVLLPFIPGLVAMAGLILGDSSLYHRFSVLDIGYAAKVAIATAFAYVFGLAATFVVGAISSFVFDKLAPTPNPGMSDSVYWRRVASQYVGPKLSPAHWTWSNEDFDNAAAYFDSFAPQPKAFKETWEKYKKLLKQYDDAVKNAALGAGNTDSATALGANGLAPHAPANAHVTDLGRTLESVRTDMRAVSSKIEWLSLQHALQLIPTTVQQPNNAFTQVAETLQAAGFVAVCMMVRYPALFDLGGLLFILALLAATTWAAWLLRKLNSFFRNSGAYQIAVMLHEMRRSSPDDGQRSGARDG